MEEAALIFHISRPDQLRKIVCTHTRTKVGYSNTEFLSQPGLDPSKLRGSDSSNFQGGQLVDNCSWNPNSDLFQKVPKAAQRRSNQRRLFGGQSWILEEEEGL